MADLLNGGAPADVGSSVSAELHAPPPEFLRVVADGQQVQLDVTAIQAAQPQAAYTAVVLPLPEDRFNDLLALFVELLPLVAA